MNPADLQALLERVRAGSIDAEADIREEIDRLRLLWQNALKHWEKAESEIPRWQPIETAPVLSAEEVLATGNIYGYVFSCLIQSKSGWVASGYAKYIEARSTAKRKGFALRWYSDRHSWLGLNGAKYWMPLPAPKEK